MVESVSNPLAVIGRKTKNNRQKSGKGFKRQCRQIKVGVFKRQTNRLKTKPNNRDQKAEKMYRTVDSVLGKKVEQQWPQRVRKIVIGKTIMKTMK